MVKGIVSCLTFVQSIGLLFRIFYGMQRTIKNLFEIRRLRRAGAYYSKSRDFEERGVMRLRKAGWYALS